LGSEPGEPIFVSIVVTVKDEGKHLPSLLTSLLAQAPPFEIVLVDALSRDHTVQVAEEFRRRAPDRLRIFRQYGSRGIGRNTGVTQARGTYIVFIDGDCIADSHWLAELRTGFATSPVVAGRTVPIGSAAFGSLDRVELFQQGNDVTFPSCNLGYRRELFERLGGFDPRFITAEDIDLNLRASQLGYHPRYVPEAIVYHEMRETFIRFLYQAFWNGYGRKQLTEKHGSLWGNYRLRRLISTQRSVFAFTRLAAAFGGYVTRVVTGSDRRLTPHPPLGAHGISTPRTESEQPAPR
jgi:GT2 family glycosyltransferase